MFTYETYSAWLIALAWLAGGIVVGAVLNRLIAASVARSRRIANNYWLELAINSLRAGIVFWCAIAGIYIALHTSVLDPNIKKLLDQILLIFWLASLTFVAARMAAGGVTFYGRSGSRLLSASLFASVAQWTVVTFGILVILSSLGIKITPILTALGVGGLAVALALKDTLANLFSGIQIVASNQIRPGDFIRIDDDMQGFVQDINWRNTTIRDIRNNLVIIPNEKLAQSSFKNFALPVEELTISAEVGVEYGSDLDLVERETLAAAAEVYADLHLASETPPVVRFLGFGDSSINLALFMRVPSYADQFAARSALIRTIYARYNKAGIGFPFPTRTVYMQSQ
ncbi:MAG TPA: mechanosensitive ion channel family protein [Candidatus Aquilonibacter sp.]|nr:mechanosensitive ion channel family protein [Candidatus Aquilonibacter sp.]